MKLADWNFHKNLKSHEMAAVVQQETEPKAQDPSAEGTFTIRNIKIDARRIERFKRDHSRLREPHIPRFRELSPV